jgi:hypothetical protein
VNSDLDLHCTLDNLHQSSSVVLKCHRSSSMSSVVLNIIRCPQFHPLSSFSSAVLVLIRCFNLIPRVVVGWLQEPPHDLGIYHRSMQQLRNQWKRSRSCVTRIQNLGNPGVGSLESLIQFSQKNLPGAIEPLSTSATTAGLVDLGGKVLLCYLAPPWSSLVAAQALNLNVYPLSQPIRSWRRYNQYRV